jgi:gluconolactonase
MKRREFFKSISTFGSTTALVMADRAAAQRTTHPGHVYPIGPDSKYQPGVPRGKVFQFLLRNPRAYPGMESTVEVYVPAQYRAEKPACVCLLLDGLAGTRAAAVFDNLIHKSEMPISIGIGLHPGINRSSRPDVNPRFDRSFEFDSMTDVLADFIIHYVLPEVQKRKTPDNMPILLSNDPNDRLIGGGSSGGIGAFNVAWRRPDAFRRVSVVSGTFVGMRGGDLYPVLIRKTEPKPLRVFINDGTHDEWWGGPEFGDWWLSNRTVESAMTFAGYEANHIWGIGGHVQQGAAVFPEMVRWLWKGWPTPVGTGKTGNFNITAILKPGEEWERVIGRERSQKAQRASRLSSFRGYFSPPVLDAHSTAAAIASDAQGQVFYMNPAEGKICRIAASGRPETFVTVSPGDNALAFGPDRRLYVAEIARRRLVAFDPSGRAEVVAEGVAGRGLTATNQGAIYLTESEPGRVDSSKVWLIHPDGEKRVVAEDLNSPSGVSLAPDGLWLFVAERHGHHGWNYQVRPDCSLRDGIPFYWFHVPDSANDSGARQTCMDREGRAYVATRMGVQVFDRNGRVTAILPVLPSAGSEQLAGVCLGGADFQTLYVTTGMSVYRRKVAAQGMPACAAPITLPHWGAG